ncbi:unnamed protein product [Enterobius vermicularis]|uniref:Apple domain-containing protein n=1 Tax=Enterobius vermicularis TaxID=51028 RepID=A0A158QAV3_ENTVE|nr:unnamed protein product [Enterobius vermicularis]
MYLEPLGPTFLPEFIYLPGYHLPSGERIVPNVLNKELCSRICYFDSLCVAFQYISAVCTTYRSISEGPTSVYLYLFRKRVLPEKEEELPIRQQIRGFVYVPGSHLPIILQSIPYLVNAESCARVCYFNHLCVGFQYGRGICVLYRSISSGENPNYIYLWLKKPAKKRSDAPKYLKKFMYVPGYHETSGGETVPNILNVELCSKTCYFNPSCVAFHYVNRNCVTYSSTQGGPRLFLYLWLKAKRQMEVEPSDGRHYLIHFVYAPGYYMPSEPKFVPNMINKERCAKTCYSNPLCTGFHYGLRVCVTYRSVSTGPTRIYVYLWLKKARPGRNRTTHGQHYLKKFLYLPGYYTPQGKQLIPNILNGELCSRLCYFNPTCVGFQYDDEECIIYRTVTQGPTRSYIYLWMRKGLSGGYISPETVEYIGKFTYVPGYFKPSGRTTVSNILNSELCAEICYTDSSCAGFQYADGVCITYRSFLQGPSLEYVYSWIKKGLPGQSILRPYPEEQYRLLGESLFEKIILDIDTKV